jgi:hypothetical protein
MTRMMCTCKFCGSPFKRSGRAYLANPFCGERQCYEERLEASGAIDMRDNHRITLIDNGYAKIEPIDPTKLFKATRKEVADIG